MKKFLALLLALVVVLGMSSVAYAAGSVVAPPAAPAGNKAAALPTVVSGDVEFKPIDEAADLPEDAQEEVKAALASIAEATPEGMVARTTVYVATNSAEPTEVTLKMDDIKDASDVVFKLYKDGKWVELEFVLNADGTITVKLPSDGTLGIFTKK